jgi:hypothetical protein
MPIYIKVDGEWKQVFLDETEEEPEEKPEEPVE